MDENLQSVLEDALQDLDDADEQPTASRTGPQPAQEHPPAAKGMAFDPLKGGKKRLPRQHKTRNQSDPADMKLPPAADELYKSFTSLLSELENFELPGESKNDSASGPAAIPENDPGLKSTLDALDAAVRQASQGAESTAQGSSQCQDAGNPENDLVASVMQKILSKSMLYEPLKEICEQYPVWFKAQGAEANLERYHRQYDLMKKICRVYETDSNNYTELMRLFQEVQECGQTPEEIINAVAPEIGSNGASPFVSPTGQPDECLQQ